jgi:hypothetical protein
MRQFLLALHDLTTIERFVKADVWERHSKVRGTGERRA